MPRSIAIAAALAVALAGCSKETASGGEEARPTQPSGKDELTPLARATHPTTDGDIFLYNLDGQIQSAQDRVEASGGADERVGLAGLQRTRAAITGSLDTYQKADELLAAALEENPEHAPAWFSRARVALALHRFGAAEDYLSRARALRPGAKALADVDQELRWARGQWTAAAKLIESRGKGDGVQRLARLGVLHHQLGRDRRSKEAFERAQSKLSSTNPLQAAWLDVQIGHALLERGRLDAAERFFRTAAERLPAYTNARRHLAEVLVLQERAEGVDIYHQLAKRARDPEAMSALAEHYAGAGKTRQAEDWAARATHRYLELAARFPEAVASHLADHYQSRGLYLPALAWRHYDLHHRPSPQQWLALGQTLGAAGDDAGAERALLQAAAGELIPRGVHQAAAWSCRRYPERSQCPLARRLAARSR